MSIVPVLVGNRMTPHAVPAAIVLKGSGSAQQLFPPRPLCHTTQAPCYNLDMQVLVDKNGCDDEAALAELGPGALLSVSQVAGRG